MLMILTIVFIFKKDNTASGEGHVNVILKNIDGEIISNDRFEYDTDDSWFNILNENYELRCNETQYGHFILGIESIETDGYKSFIWLETAYLNEGIEYSDNIVFDNYTCGNAKVGIDSLEIIDNMILGIVERDNTHQTSIFTDDINISVKDSSYKIFKIIVYILITCMVLGLIIYGIIYNKVYGEKLDIRKMCIISLMAVILFVQEELLTILPNIQLTFLLLSLFAVIFGIKYSLLIVSIHVILDNMVMGSLTPVVMIPMFLGYTILIVVMWLLKKEKLPIKIIGASICAWIYCMLFLIANAIFLDIDIHAYFVSDIPFEILLILSTIFSMTYLYRPLEKVISREWNKNVVEDVFDQDN